MLLSYVCVNASTASAPRAPGDTAGLNSPNNPRSRLTPDPDSTKPGGQGERAGWGTDRAIRRKNGCVTDAKEAWARLPIASISHSREAEHRRRPDGGCRPGGFVFNQGIDLSGDLDRVVAWRIERLRDAGFSAPLADTLARDARDDVHALLELTDRGCPDAGPRQRCRLRRSPS